MTSTSSCKAPSWRSCSRWTHLQVQGRPSFAAQARPQETSSLTAPCPITDRLTEERPGLLLAQGALGKPLCFGELPYQSTQGRRFPATVGVDILERVPVRRHKAQLAG